MRHRCRSSHTIAIQSHQGRFASPIPHASVAARHAASCMTESCTRLKRSTHSARGALRTARRRTHTTLRFSTRTFVMRTLIGLSCQPSGIGKCSVKPLGSPRIIRSAGGSTAASRRSTSLETSLMTWSLSVGSAVSGTRLQTRTEEIGDNAPPRNTLTRFRSCPIIPRLLRGGRFDVRGPSFASLSVVLNSPQLVAEFTRIRPPVVSAEL